MDVNDITRFEAHLFNAPGGKKYSATLLQYTFLEKLLNTQNRI